MMFKSFPLGSDLVSFSDQSIDGVGGGECQRTRERAERVSSARARKHTFEHRVGHRVEHRAQRRVDTSGAGSIEHTVGHGVGHASVAAARSGRAEPSPAQVELYSTTSINLDLQQLHHSFALQQALLFSNALLPSRSTPGTALLEPTTLASNALLALASSLQSHT